MCSVKQQLGFGLGGGGSSTPIRASSIRPAFSNAQPLSAARRRTAKRLTWCSHQQAVLGPNQASSSKNGAELEGMHIMEQTVPVTLATAYMKTAMETATELVGQVGPAGRQALDRVEAALKSAASKQDVEKLLAELARLREDVMPALHNNKEEDLTADKALEQTKLDMSALQHQMTAAVATKEDVVGVKASIDGVAAHVSSVDGKLAGFQAEIAELKAMLLAAAATSAASAPPTTGSNSISQALVPAATPPAQPSTHKEEKEGVISAEPANRAPPPPSSSAPVRLTTTDGAVITADRQLLAASSKVVSDILAANNNSDTFALNATKQTVELLLQVLSNQRHPRLYLFTQDSSALGPSVWDEFKPALELAHKYDMQVAKDRIEKWLISRRLRGEITMGRGFSFNSFDTACDWLRLCCKYGMRDLGWYMAHDVGGKLMTAGVPPAQVLAGITDTELLMVIVDRSTGRS